MRVCLVGAGNRVQAAQQMFQAAKRLGLDIRAFSIEKSVRVPIAQHVPVEVFDEDFESENFLNFLLSLGLLTETLFVPFMDSAARAIAAARTYSELISPAGDWVINLRDKSEQKKIASLAGLPVPEDVSSGDAHIRPRVGNSSKGIGRVFIDEAHLRKEDYLYEELIDGPEVSLDAYVTLEGEVRISARDRLRITGGEVQHTAVRRPSELESQYAIDACKIFGVRGPCNLQFMGYRPRFLEINPRFGGGSTASVQAGWEAWVWLFQEYLQAEKAGEYRDVRPLEMMRAWTDYYWSNDGNCGY